MQIEDIWSDVVTHPESFLSDPRKTLESDYFPLSLQDDDCTEFVIDSPFEDDWNLSSSLTDSELVDQITSVMQAISGDPQLNAEFCSLPESPASSPLLDMEAPLNLPYDVALALEKSLTEPQQTSAIVVAPPSIAFIDCTTDEDDEEEVIELSSSSSLISSPPSNQSTPRSSPPAPPTLPYKITFTHEKQKKSSPKKRSSVKTKTSKSAPKKKKPQKPFYESEEDDSDIEATLFDDDERTKKKKRKTKKQKEDEAKLKARVHQPQPPVTISGYSDHSNRNATAIAFLEKRNNFAPELLAKTFSSTEVLKMGSKNQTDEEGDVDIL